MRGPTVFPRRTLVRLGGVVFALSCSITACRSVDDATAAMAGHAAYAPVAYHSGGKLDIADYRDCNHNAIDGRETDVRWSAAHCGECDHPCRGVCQEGSCLMSDASAPDAGPAGDAAADASSVP